MDILVVSETRRDFQLCLAAMVVLVTQGGRTFTREMRWALVFILIGSTNFVHHRLMPHETSNQIVDMAKSL